MKIKLTPEQKRKRVEWCKCHLNKSFENIVFADKKPWTIGKTQQTFYHKPDGPRPTIQVSKYPETFSIYASISRKRKSQITIWKGHQNSEYYCDTLEQSLVPFIKPYHSRYHIYYHDLDTTHCSNYTKNWLETNRIKHDYLPPNSPNLNPLEFVWRILDARVSRHSPKGFKEYKKWIFQEWNNISMEEIQKWIDRLPQYLHLDL